MESIQNSAVEELPEPMSKDDVSPQKQQHKLIKPNAAPMTQTQDAAEQAGDNAAQLTSKNHKKPTAPSVTATGGANLQQRPPKKYSSPRTASTTSSVPTADDNSRTAKDAASSSSNIGEDDFKYPYQKYSKAANFRFDDDGDAWRPFAPKTQADDIYGLPSGSGSGSGSGYFGAFYDPETGRKYTPQNMDRDEWHAKVHERVRRATAANLNENKNTCSLYIQTDPLIWRHIREGIADVSIK